MEINIDVTDWDDEAAKEELDISTKEALLKARMEKGYHPAKMARMYIVAREREQTDPDLLASNKLLLMTGGAYGISQMEATDKQSVQLKNGHTIQVRSLLAAVPEDEEEEGDGDGQLEMDAVPPKTPEPPDENPGPVYWDDPLAEDRARAYLMRKVPGYVYSRLAIIAANEGDVYGAWNAFVDLMETRIKLLV